MVGIGTKDEQLLGDKFVLYEGRDSWDLKVESELTLSRPKNINGTPSGPVLAFGVGEHVFDATILASVADIARIIGYNRRDDNGALPNREWRLVATSVSGAETATITFNGEMGNLRVKHQPQGKVDFIIRIDITDDNVEVS